jgi:peptidoglycan/LPS O-acetylase OafA/YrhL
MNLGALEAKPQPPIAERGASHPSFPNLDGLRFLAFLAVYLHHGFGRLTRFAPNSRILSALLFEGDLGVSFFFVLSGFLITYLLLVERTTRGRVDVPAFWMRRVLRIWPLYYAVVVAGFWIYPWAKAALGYGPYLQVGNPIFYLLFLGNFDVIAIGPGHGALCTNITWSVAIEEQFYACWPVLFLLPLRLLPSTFSIILGGSMLFRWVHRADAMVAYFHTLSVISDMALGGLAAFAVATRRELVDRLRRTPRALIVACYAVAGLIIWFRHSLDALPAWQFVARVVLGLFFAFVILEQNYCAHSFLKASSFRIVSRLGAVSYGLYLLHPIVLTLLDRIGYLLSIALTPWSILANGLLGLLLTVGLSLLSYRYFEKPFLNLKHRFSRLPSAGARPAIAG